MIPNLRKRYTAYVVFQGAEHRRFWRMFCRRGWRHVFLIHPAYYPEPGLMAQVYSVVINPHSDHVRTDVVFKHPADICASMLREGVTACISIPIDQKFTGRYVPRGFITCVSLVKIFLGIGAWYVWTPEQLARYLLRNGGTLMEIPK